MLGPALQQLFSDLSNVPEAERSEYENELYQELKPLIEIRETWAAKMKELKDWSSDTGRSYNISLESTIWDNNNIVRTEGYRITVDPKYISANRAAGRGDVNRFNCKKEDCPNKKI
jgi:hypothetical protein